MKKLLWTIFATLTAALFSMMMISCGPDEPGPSTGSGTVAVTGVSLNKSSLSLEEGGSETLTATVTPSNATNKTVSWSSSSSAVATVDNSGKVTAVKAGSATITVTTADGGKTATCDVTVSVPVESVSISVDETEVEVEGEVTLEAAVAPEDASDKTVTWSSSDESVAKVDAAGKVTGVAEGEATITVTSADGGKTATCKVTVTPKTIPVESVSVDPTTVDLVVGESTSVTVTITPAEATNKALSYTSSDETVATVDAEGKVTGVKSGSATITVTTEDGGKTATFEVNVTVPVEGVSLNETEAEVPVEGELTLIATITPEDATDKTVSWTSSDESVATVSDGKVTGVKTGEAVITASSADGKTAECKITVTPKVIPVESVSVDKETITIIEGGSASMTVTITPAEATNKAVSFKSSDETVATVDAEGKVTGVKPGKATITVTTEDGGKTATCAVTVTTKEVKVTGVSLDKTTLTMDVDNTEKLTATVEPADATDQSVTWKSSNTSVATVSSTGEVTARAKGTTTITVTTKDGAKTATCKVTVTQPVTAIKIIGPDNKETSFHWQYIAWNDKTYQLKATVEPSSASNKEVTWSSTDTDAITVDQNGLVTFKKESFDAFVVCSAKDGSGVSARVMFSINERTADNITLTSSGGTANFQTRPNGTFKVTAALKGNGQPVFNNKVTWSLSSNASSYAEIVSYDNLTCTIKGLKNTTSSSPVTLTATYKSLNGKVTKTVSQQIGISGRPFISSISINVYQQISVGGEYGGQATVKPDDAYVNLVKWTTSDSTVVKLIPQDYHYRIRFRGMKKGRAIIKCVSYDGSGVESNEMIMEVK